MQLREAEDRVERRAQFMAHAGEEVGLRAIGLLRRGHRLVQLRFDALAHGIVGADQQVADDVAVVVAQRGDRHDGRKAAAVLADVGQLVDVLDFARGLERQRLEARRDGGRELEAQRLGARHHFLRIVDVARADPVDDFGGLVAQHALGADVEQLDDALLVGGDDREVGAGQDRVLQRARLQQRDWRRTSVTPSGLPGASGTTGTGAESDIAEFRERVTGTGRVRGVGPEAGWKASRRERTRLERGE